MPTLQGDESAYVGVWASPTPQHMPASFLAVALFSSLLGDHWAEDLVAADGSPQPAAADLSPTEPIVRGDYCRRGVPHRRQNRSLTPACVPQTWQYTGEASDSTPSPSGRLAGGRGLRGRGLRPALSFPVRQTQ